MKLEKFKKYGKRNKKIICSVIGIVLIICGVLLLKSFAFFESQYDFNVIKGRVPDFVVGDVTLAINVNGTPSTTMPTSKRYKVDVTCDNEAVGSWDYENWGPNIKNVSKKTKCQLYFKTDTSNLYYQSDLGDYVSYTPSKTSYIISKNLTGYSSDQTINPSELNLWRVIKKKNDGTIELVSQYISSTYIHFVNREAYRNYVGILNLIASQYTINDITSSSRYVGYNGQTEVILDTSKIFNLSTVPWNDDTSESNYSNIREKQGGGDLFHLTDIELLKKIYGNDYLYKKVNDNTGGRFWIASRMYDIHDNNYWQLRGRLSNGYLSSDNDCAFDSFYYGGFVGQDCSAGLVPIVIAKSGILSKGGNGTSTSPWKLN